ncbi:hypothetical protein GCM10007100_39960 [Roseibacillus persicicus]|uniref:Uncharacterized protein n=2 Tax=Roseibacillus persicicus TaxID=454148 RepID=A0A918TYV5_9BACT|nr:hypothetical protein GCM10007100_39960 [Roseibacillus persicicus]
MGVLERSTEMNTFRLKFLIIILLGFLPKVFAQDEAVVLGPSDIFDAVVKKVYSAKTEFGSSYRAYVIDWRGSEVVVHDLFGSTTNKIGETISVTLTEQSFRVQGELYSRVFFTCAKPSQDALDISKRAEKALQDAKELLDETKSFRKAEEGR